MTASKEQLADLQRKNIEAAMHLAQLSVDQSQRILALQTELSSLLLKDGLANAKALSSAKSPQELMSLRSEIAQGTAERMVETAQRIAEVTNEAREEFARVMAEQMTTSRNELATAFKDFFKSMPGGNEAFSTMVEQALSTANAAFDQIVHASNAAFGSMNEAARQVARRSKKA